jgi:PhnB protein
MDLAPQLAFNGQCREAFDYYAKLLGGRITVMNTFGGNEARALPPGSVAGPAEKIRFAEIRFGSNSLRGNDVSDDQFTPMDGFNVSLHVESTEEDVRIFDGLEDGATSRQPWSKWIGPNGLGWSLTALGYLGSFWR